MSTPGNRGAVRPLLSRLAAALAWGTPLLLVPAWAIRSPFLSSARPWASISLVALGLGLGVVLLHRAGGSRLRWAQAAFCLGAAALVLGVEGAHLARRHAVLNTDPSLLERLGQHLVVGFDDFSEAESLVSRGAVGGVYLKARVTKGLSVEELSDAIERLQAGRRFHGQPPLLVMADQEGGLVSHLSPPLPRQPSLAESLGGSSSTGERLARTESYAREQAVSLAAVGVNVNLAPVVDVPVDGPEFLDIYTRISHRALAREPRDVAELAAAYVKGLEGAGVLATLKHFPGLGRVEADTHFFPAHLSTDPAKLGRTDWLPFREASRETSTLVMVSHVTLDRVDPSRPASRSQAVVTGVLRERLGFPGVVVTDDLCMGPMAHGEGGIGGAGVDALRAGADLLLVSFDGAQYFEVMSALLEAEQDGALPEALLSKSRGRLARLVSSLRPRPASHPEGR